MTIEGKRIAVVTGAGRGIGLAIVWALVEDGYTVVAGSRTITDALRDATEDVLELDLAVPDGPDRLVRHALHQHEGIDLLVNNVAGTSTLSGGFDQLDDDAWSHTFDLTFMSAVRTTRAALPSLLERRGAVVNISSINAHMAQPRLIAQSAAKAALSNLGKALAAEFSGHRAGRGGGAGGLPRLRSGGQYERFGCCDRRRNAEGSLNSADSRSPRFPSLPMRIPASRRQLASGSGE